MKKAILLVVWFVVSLYGGNSVNIGGNNINPGTQIFNMYDNSQNKYKDDNKALYESRIMQISRDLTKKENADKIPTLSTVIGVADKVNALDISPKKKVEHCIEYGVGFNLFKIDLNLFRKKCETIFK